MTVEQHQRPRDVALLNPASGFLVGLAAGAVMGAVVMAGSAVSGRGLWTPINAIGSFFGDVTAAGPAFAGGTTLVGITIQLGMGGLLGALYASAIERMDTPSLMMVSVYYGGMIWIVSTFLVFSWLRPAFEPVARSWPMLLGSLAFGAVLGLAAATRNKPVTRVHSPD